MIKKNMIKIGFACVDEVHCMSEWSHNFRPSYLLIKDVLNSLGIDCVVGLTATATIQTQISICSALGIEGENVIKSSTIRENLSLTVSRDSNR